MSPLRFLWLLLRVYLVEERQRRRAAADLISPEAKRRAARRITPGRGVRA